MKSLGPYVAARELSGQRPLSAVRTLHATDRLTGMPVLLHVLPHAVSLPALPPDPALLPPSDGGVTGETAYLITELPPHARAASDPLLAARGGLRALAALHEAGLTHGGVSSAQLWSVDGQVVLVGAGLPWGGQPSPAADLRDLLVSLEMLGGVPPALRGVPLEEVSARDLLGRLEAPPAPAPTPPAAQVPPPQVPVQAVPAPGVSPPGSTAPPPRVRKGKTAPPVRPASGGPVPSHPVPSHPVPGDAVPGNPPLKLGGALADTLWNAKPSAPLPVRLPEAPLSTESPVEDSALLVVTPGPPAPARQEAPPPPAPPEEREQPGEVSEADPLVIRADPQPGVRREPLPGARVPSRRMTGEPVRIVWNADGTRRVVKSDGAALPRRSWPGRTPPLLPLVGLLLLLGVVGGVWAWLAHRPVAGVQTPPPVTLVPTACCDVRFTVRGEQGVPVRLSVISAPQGSPVEVGQVLGRAPGVLRLPGPGTYTLRVTAQGYAPGKVTIEAPTRAPVQVALSP